jgi:hypothetical protein
MEEAYLLAMHQNISTTLECVTNILACSFKVRTKVSGWFIKNIYAEATEAVFF